MATSKTKKEPKVEATKKAALSDLDKKVAALAAEVEAAAKQVGGDIARGYAVQAAAKLREVENLLYRGEREDK